MYTHSGVQYIFPHTYTFTLTSTPILTLTALASACWRCHVTWSSPQGDKTGTCSDRDGCLKTSPKVAVVLRDF